MKKVLTYGQQSTILDLDIAKSVKLFVGIKNGYTKLDAKMKMKSKD